MTTKLTDHEVVLVLKLVDEGLSYSVIADKMEISKGTVADYVSGRRRRSLGGPTVNEPAPDPIEERMSGTGGGGRGSRRKKKR